MSKHIGTLLISVVAMVASMACAATPAASGQTHFSTPDNAVDALIGANRENNRRRLLAILGIDGSKLIRSGDPVEDEQGRTRLVSAFDEAHKIEFNGPDKAVLIVGRQEWPLPIPLIRERSGWRFDTGAGEEEVLNRRIGRNEIKVMEVCRAYVEAQREYAALKIGGQPGFAGRFMSSRGQHDGLYWPVKPGDPESPLGPLVAQAQARGYSAGESAPAPTAPQPYHGYYFRILTAQGPNAPGGAKSYIAGNRMTQGFALIAYPATFGDSGIMTFIVNNDGIIFERNLGSDTGRLALQMNRYDPDPSWRAPR